MMMALAATAAGITAIEAFIAGVSITVTAYGVCKTGKKPKLSKKEQPVGCSFFVYV